MNNFCTCYDCESSDNACKFDCHTDFLCEGCAEAYEAILDEEFDVKSAQGCI